MKPPLEIEYNANLHWRKNIMQSSNGGRSKTEIQCIHARLHCGLQSSKKFNMADYPQLSKPTRLLKTLINEMVSNNLFRHAYLLYVASSKTYKTKSKHDTIFSIMYSSTMHSTSRHVMYQILLQTMCIYIYIYKLHTMSSATSTCLKNRTVQNAI